MFIFKILKIRALLILVAFLSLGCEVKYVADYDASIQEEVIQIAKKVDLFWGNLLDTPVSERQYSNFMAEYNEIETDIRGLYMRNQIRPKNETTTTQVQSLLELWVEDKNIHKTEDSFSDFEARRHRKDFVRVFTAIAKGEGAKQTNSEPDTQ